jgi:hypothetical protein
MLKSVEKMKIEILRNGEAEKMRQSLTKLLLILLGP